MGEKLLLHVRSSDADRGFHFFFFNDTATTEIYTLSLHDALPVSPAPTPTATTPTQVITNPTAQTAGSSSLSSASVAVIVLGAVAVLGGIAYFIWRDARRRAPLQHGD